MERELKGSERWAVLYVGSIGWTPNVVLPYEVESAMQRFGLSEMQAGWMSTTELLVLATIALWLSRRVSAVDKSRWALGAGLVAALSTAGALVASSLPLYLSCKMAAGAAVGVLIACCYGLAPYYRHPEKVFAQIGATMAVLFGAVMYLVPVVIAHAGPKGLELVLIALYAVGALGALRLPRSHAAMSDVTQSVAGPGVSGPRGVYLLLGAVAALFVSQTAALTFATSAGIARQLDAEQIGAVFTASMLAQLPAALLAGWLGNRFGFALPILAGLVGLVLSAIGMYELSTASWFIAGACLLNAGAMLANAYLIAALAKLDATGRSTATAGSITNYGMAFGPALAGVAVGVSGQLERAGWLCVGLLLLAALLVLLARGRGISEMVVPHTAG